MGSAVAVVIEKPEYAGRNTLHDMQDLFGPFGPITFQATYVAYPLSTLDRNVTVIFGMLSPYLFARHYLSLHSCTGWCKETQFNGFMVHTNPKAYVH